MISSTVSILKYQPQLFTDSEMKGTAHLVADRLIIVETLLEQTMANSPVISL